MDKIEVVGNRLTDFKDQDIEITNNRIRFIKSGEYTLEYINCDKVNLEVEVLDDVVVSLFIFNMNGDIEIDNHYVLGKNAYLDLYKFAYSGNVGEKLIFDLNGENSKLNYHFSSISRRSEEYHIIVNHNNCNVSSDVVNKCIGLDKSSLKLVIDSVLMKGNSNCFMDQTSRILTLGDVDATIVPNMLIEEDDVTAKHGSVVGRISPEDIFYLMSRGIDEEEAVNLLIKGFIFSNLAVKMDLRARIFQVIQDLRR